MSGNASKRYPPELRKRAVRMVAEIRADHESEWAAIGRVAQLLGVKTPEPVRQWGRQGEVHAGEGGGVTSEESAEVKRLKRENAELKRANAILKAASAFFAAVLAELTGPSPTRQRQRRPDRPTTSRGQSSEH